MAEETKPVSVPEEVVAVTVPDVDATTTTPTVENEADAPPAASEPELAEKSVEEEPAVPAVTEEADEKKISQSNSFKEETNVVSDLPEPQRKALEELKKLIQEALEKHEFTDPPPPPVVVVEEEKKKVEEVTTEETPAAAVTEDEKKDDVTVTEAAEEPAKIEKETTTPAEKIEEKETEVVVKEVEVETEKPAVVSESEPETKTVVEETTTTEVVEETDGAKTVEAIEESVVNTTTTPTEPETDKKIDDSTTTETPPPQQQPEETPILYGIPILNSPKSDVLLLKFLRARDFKLQPTLTMIKKCIRWRTEFGVDKLLNEDLGNDYEKVVFAHGHDKQGRLVVYNVFGEFKDKELYQLAFSDAEKQKKLLKWLVQFVERIVREFDFSPTGINSFVVVNDLCNSPGYGKREVYKVINKFGALLQDNYPEFVSKQICINVSFWYLAYSWVYVNVFTPRSKSKFVFSSSSKTPETLFRYISPEQVPVQYGGHSRTGDSLEFTPEDPVSEVTIKPSSNFPLEFEFKEACTFVWELRVVGWEVNYEAQFVPNDGYTVLVSKGRKMTLADEPIICDSFDVKEAGKVVITIDNHGSSKKKKLLYRTKIKSSSE